MIIAVFLMMFAIFFYLLLRGSAGQRDWAQEDLEQAEYLREYCRRRTQRKKKRQQTG